MGLGGLVEHFCSGGAAPRLSPLRPSSEDRRGKQESTLHSNLQVAGAQSGDQPPQPLPAWELGGSSLSLSFP